MIKLSTVPIIEITSDVGLYGFAGNAATGKTFLYKLFKQLRESGNMNILPFTYSVDLSEKEIIKKIQNFEKGIIFLDRFDLYVSDEILEELYKKHNTCLILFDLKNWDKLTVDEDGLADVFMSEDVVKVEVYEDSF